jgi:hypothetical protein
MSYWEIGNVMMRVCLFGTMDPDLGAFGLLLGCLFDLFMLWLVQSFACVDSFRLNHDNKKLRGNQHTLRGKKKWAQQSALGPSSRYIYFRQLF